MRHFGLLGITAFTAVAFCGCEEDKEKVLVLKPETLYVSSPDQILPIEDTLVRPVLYQNAVRFGDLPVEECKKKFIETVLPAILVSRYRISEDRQRIRQLQQKEKWTGVDSSFYLHQKKRFGAQNLPGLLKRMQTHPNCIVLAQAAVETGWGQSRFFQEGNNLFGMWSYRVDEPRIRASLGRGDHEVYLRKYHDISESIDDYFETIGRSRHYRHFREARSKTSAVPDLLPHLKYYSERRMAYIEQLQTIIAQNDLTRYDKYQIDPMYIVWEDPDSAIHVPSLARQDF